MCHHVGYLGITARGHPCKGGGRWKWEGDGNGREAYTQNGSYNHKYHFFIGTTLNGGIWQSKFQCKTLHGRRSDKVGTSSAGTGDRGQGQTSPHNEHQGRFHPEQGIGLGVEMGLWLGVMYGRGTTPTFKNVRQFANATSRVEQSLK